MKYRLHLVAIILIMMCAACGRPTLDDQLIEASGGGNTNEISRLLALGVDVNCTTHSLDNSTSLIWAVRERKEQSVLTLLAASADPNKRDGHKNTALFYAFTTEDDLSNIITALITAGALTDEYDSLFMSLPKDHPNRVAFINAKIAVKRIGVRK